MQRVEQSNVLILLQEKRFLDQMYSNRCLTFVSINNWFIHRFWSVRLRGYHYHKSQWFGTQMIYNLFFLEFILDRLKSYLKETKVPTPSCKQDFGYSFDALFQIASYVSAYVYISGFKIVFGFRWREFQKRFGLFVFVIFNICQFLCVIQCTNQI